MVGLQSLDLPIGVRIPVSQSTLMVKGEWCIGISNNHSSFTIHLL